MRSLFLLLGLVFTMGTLNAQYYFSLSGGAAVGTQKSVLGQEVTKSSSEDLKGSYGEGFTVQGRIGYYVTPKIAIDLGVGYLHGADQTVQTVDRDDLDLEFIARGRAVGLSLGAKCDITESIYVRAAGLTKVAGKTEFIGSSNKKFPAQLINPAAPEDATVNVRGDVKRDIKGKFSVGFLGALGYEYPIADNVLLFGEIEYFSLNVDRNTSDFVEFTGAIGDQPISREELVTIISSRPAEEQADLYKLYPVFGSIKYVDEPSAPDEQKTTDPAPYSSIGLNVGITFKF